MINKHTPMSIARTYLCFDRKFSYWL